jgi:phosphoribosylformylglycinamidine synthase PurS subunit
MGDDGGEMGSGAIEPPRTDGARATTWLARIHVTLKPVVLDPQGDAVLGALHQLGFADVSNVRVGKYLEATLAAPDESAATALVTQMCARLLANPVIESYRFTVERQGAEAEPAAP